MMEVVAVSKLHIGVMSSYNECCGISAYTERLLSHLSKDVDITLLRNTPYNKVPATNYANVKDLECFKVTIWTNEIYFDEAAALAAVQEIDVLHVQFESALYHASWLIPFLTKVRALGIKVVCTAHSSCIWPGLASYIDVWLSHSESLAASLNGLHIHMPIPLTTRRDVPETKDIVSFGLGRNDDGMVYEALDTVRATHPDALFRPNYGSNKWLTDAELLDYLYSGSTITLLYPPIGAEVRSSSAALALGVCRPLIVTDTGWFKTALDTFGRRGEQGLYAVNSIAELAETLNTVLSLPPEEINDQFSRRSAIAHEKGMTLDQVAQGHLGIYKGLTCSS